MTSLSVMQSTIHSNIFKYYSNFFIPFLYGFTVRYGWMDGITEIDEWINVYMDWWVGG